MKPNGPVRDPQGSVSGPRTTCWKPLIYTTKAAYILTVLQSVLSWLKNKIRFCHVSIHSLAARCKHVFAALRSAYGLGAVMQAHHCRLLVFSVLVRSFQCFTHGEDMQLCLVYISAQNNPCSLFNRSVGNICLSVQLSSLMSTHGSIARSLASHRFDG